MYTRSFEANHTESQGGTSVAKAVLPSNGHSVLCSSINVETQCVNSFVQVPNPTGNSTMETKVKVNFV